MITLSQVKPTTRNLLAAAAFFAGDTVLDDGTMARLATTAVQRGDNEATIVTAVDHGLYTGAIANITGITIAGFNSVAASVTVATPNTFRYENPGEDVPGTYDSGGIVALSGRTVEAEEAALREDGRCLIVLPLLEGTTIDQGKGLALLQVIVPVRVAVNPDHPPCDSIDMIREVVATLTQRTPVAHPKDRYELDTQAFEVADADSGVLAYHIFFRKHCTI